MTENGPGTICAGVPSSLGFGVGGQSYSNFLASSACFMCRCSSVALKVNDHVPTF